MKRYINNLLYIIIFNGGNMHRLFRLSLMVVLLGIFAFNAGEAAKPSVEVAGSLAPGQVRVFLKDTTYKINQSYVVGGTLIIEPGTEILFGYNSRLIDSVGGRIIADGFAHTIYNANPNGENPNDISSPWGGPGGEGYATLDYFLFESADPDDESTIEVGTTRDLTVNDEKFVMDPLQPLQFRSKENYVYNVLLNKDTRRIIDFQPEAGANGKHMDPPYDPDGNYSTAGDEIVIIPFEKAIMFTAARLYTEPSSDLKLRINHWKRTNEGNVELDSNEILFRGQPTNNFSEEWGHIVIMPGARAAFFRNCRFENMRKDTTVDNKPFYQAGSFPELNATEFAELTNNMRLLTNGTGGAITTFSSRTWLLNCTFADNFARHRGGALAIMQAPDGFPNPNAYYPMFYRNDKNPQMTNRDASISDINTKTNEVAQIHPQVDLLDERDDLDGGVLGMEFYEDYDRQSFDDARLSVLMGRMRNLKFERNIAQLANYGQVLSGGEWGTEDLYDEPAKSGREYGDAAFGGAVYISGKKTNISDERYQLEIGLGVNNAVNNAAGTITFPEEDEFECYNNRAYNYQKSDKTFGARGGAIYIGENTSLIVAGKFHNNQTNAPFMQDYNTVDTEGNLVYADPEMIKYAGRYSRGGAIYLDNADGRLQVRGGPYRDDEELTADNPTEFFGNSSAAGGAIYVAGVRYRDLMSPIIGGSNASITSRNYGFNIKFQDNYAVVDGGAIYTERNTTIYGAGGHSSDEIIGYGGLFPINFENNKAGYSGGAIKFYVPDGTEEVENRVVHVVRAEFIGNEVGNPDYMFADDRYIIAGGGAIYSVNADLNLVQATEFRANKVYDGNGGAVALIHPLTSTKRFFITDIDAVNFSTGIVANEFTSTNEVFANSVTDPAVFDYPADERMMTRFYDNEIIVDPMIADSVNGSGTTQINHSQIETNASFLAFSFVANKGFAVGTNGAIVKFVDGEKDSESNYQNHLITLRDVQFISETIGFAVGDAGVIAKTTDGGQTWVEKISNTNEDLNSLVFPRTTIGYVCGDNGTLIKTVDQGETWTLLSQSATEENLNSIDFIDEFYGVAVGDQDRVTDEGTIIFTTNGGTTWAAEASGTVHNLHDVSYKDLGIIFAVGEAVVLKTVDPYADAWATVYTDLAENFNAIFVNDTVLTVVGDHGTIMMSPNSGFQWQSVESGTDLNLYSIYYVDKDVAYIGSQLGLILKTTDGGTAWEVAVAINELTADVTRYHPNLYEMEMPENGIGLGGALYVLDENSADRANRVDSVMFNRVRMQNNKSYSGAAIYSDNYNLRFIFSRSLITGNEAYSDVGFEQNYISGPLFGVDGTTYNYASSDLAGAIIYGEVEGPLPAWTAPEAGNSIYGNEARFLIRLPDAPNSKGILPADYGVGSGGVDTLRGNYWGRTDANLQMYITNNKPAMIRDLDNDGYYEDTVYHDPLVFETFYVATDFDGNIYKSDELRETTTLPYMWGWTDGDDPREQGPFESIGRFDYEPIELYNADGTENEAGPFSIPEKLLMSGIVYDGNDKGTDIKVLDYANRNMQPIEDFAVGIPPLLRRYDDPAYPSGTPDATGHTKYVRRWKRDPFVVDSIIDKNPDAPYNSIIGALQDEFRPDEDDNFTHPIGYPLFLETKVNYEGEAEVANHDPRTLNESVFFVINMTTSDFVRISLRQVTEEGPRQEVFRGRLELVPDPSFRSTDFTLRRSSEGLLTFGDLLTDLDKDPYNEAYSTLLGRKYHEMYEQQNGGGPVNRFGGLSNIFSNRETMPESNDGNQTFFAGERYGALPVAVGDQIRVISRTVLWREGGNVAWRDGLEFIISESTFPPDFTHEIIRLQTDTIVKYEPSQYPWERDPLDSDPEFVENRIEGFLNRVFITEDRTYPWIEDMARNGERFSERSVLGGQGRDSILTATAMDNGKFYDPRAFLYEDYFTQLTYKWEVADNSGLRRWLQADTIWAGPDADGMRTDEEREDDALGYVEFRGMPINPFVVPGGEKCTLIVENYPPHYRTTDVLRELGNEVDTIEGQYIPPVGQDTIDQFIYLYPQYLHAGAYDVENARHLQQDTIDPGQNYWRSYEFEIFVIDSMPRFIPPDAETEEVYRRIEGFYPDGAREEEPYVVYEPSVYTCNETDDGRLIANLTDSKLRFQIDINTDDECEDYSNATQADFIPGVPAWDFRYGKTAYGFLNTAVVGDEIIIMDIDTNEFNTDLSNMDDGRDTILSQTRPVWMKAEYICRYGTDDVLDEYGSDFQTKGQLNIRIPAEEARGLLTPPEDNRHAEEFNTDTTISVVVNDGHGGINVKEFEIFINFAPEIRTQSLADAIEDTCYNEYLQNNLIDSSGFENAKRIHVYDPNFNQYHTFRLIYVEDFEGEDEFSYFKDTCYEEAGNWTITLDQATPDWLKINRESGLLYGTPSIDDAPRDVKVSVLVEDENGLTALKTFDLHVDSTRHNPDIFASAKVKCVDYGQAYAPDTIYVSDRDLLRGIYGEEEDSSWVETLTVEIVEPTGAGLKFIDSETGEWVDSPIQISGIRDEIADGEWDDTVRILIGAESFTPDTRDADGKVTIVIRVTDQDGNTKELTYRLKLSDPTEFICPVIVANALGGAQTLEFGTAKLDATTGDGADGEEVGDLNENFCEYELPPIPHTDIFDVRWTIPLTNGILRNVFPTSKHGVNDERVYKAIFQAGGENGNPSTHYPVTISWIPDSVPTWDESGDTWHIRDAASNGGVFDYNMNLGTGNASQDCKGSLDTETGYFVITIKRSVIDAFIIVHTWNAPDPTGVEEPVAGLPVFGIQSVSPNPVKESGEMKFVIGVNEPGQVKLEIVDAVGNVVALVTNSYWTTGMHEIIWNHNSKLASGTYTVRMSSGSEISTQQLVILN